VQQVGPAREIYDRPDNPFVAGFIGNTNFMDGHVEGATDTEVKLRLSGGGVVDVARDFWRGGDIQAGKRIRAAVRPEMLALGPVSEAAAIMQGKLTSTTFLGEGSTCKLSSGDKEIQVVVPFGGTLPAVNDTVGVRFLTKNVPVFAA